MNKQEAIKWVRDKYQGFWPNNTKSPYPKGWRWVVSNKPYQSPEYKLVNSKFIELTKNDVYL